MIYRDGEIRLSVRALCEAAHLCGDLDLRSSGASLERLREGTAIHRELQSGRGEHYRAEIALDCRVEYAGVVWSISGVADGVLERNGETVLEEIKTVSGRLPDAPLPAHLSQLRCYGYFYCEKQGLDSIGLSLTYYSVSSERTSCFEFLESRESLRLSLEGLLARLTPRALRLKNRAEVLLPTTAKNLVFPYGELRAGQGELVSECYRSIKNGKRLFAQAPTGIGKTLSVMYPAMRALSDGHCDKIFYLTAKSSTRREAFAAAKRLHEGGARLRSCVITARDQCCLCEAAKASGRVSSYCNPIDCPYARGYYDRAESAIFWLLDGKYGYSRLAIDEAARRFSVCPYELSLDLSEYCDLIICDYNYAFDGAVYLRRYFAPDAERCDSVFLVDEAHNLPDRARSMYSCELLRGDFEALYTASGRLEVELDAILEKVIRFLYGLRRLCRDNLVKASDGERGFYMTRQTLPGLRETMAEFCAAAEKWRRGKREHRLYSALSDLISAARKCLLVSEYYDERFLTYVELLGGETRVRIFCLDPSGVLGERLSRAKSAVLFSATLTPLDYFTELCGGGEAVTLDLPSPFPPENLCLVAVDSVSTRSDDRNDRSYRRISTCIAATVSSRAGNYICYFPSYTFMERVHALFSKKYPEVETVVQRRGMTLSEKESFLSRFEADEGVLRVGFCVMGGSFSEGVDLPGKRLIGSIVVGCGIGAISNERNILRDYYDLRAEMRGYDYAYTYPGMNQVLQAAGRVIRRDDDRGIVVLIDDRYGTPQYADLFPEQWSGLQYARNPASLAEVARRFWKKGENSK